MTNTKKLITFILTIAMFAVMSTTAFAATKTYAVLTDEDCRTIAAWSQAEQIAYLTAMREAGTPVSVDDKVKIGDYVIYLRQTHQTNADKPKAKYADAIRIGGDLGFCATSLGSQSGDYGTQIVTTYNMYDAINCAMAGKGYTWYRYTDIDHYILNGIYTPDSKGIIYKGYQTRVYIATSQADLGEAQLTRRDFAVYMTRNAKYTGLTDKSSTVTFNDADKFIADADYTVEEAKTAAQFMVDYGVMELDENGNFNPDELVNGFELWQGATRLYTILPECPNDDMVISTFELARRVGDPDYVSPLKR